MPTVRLQPDTLNEENARFPQTPLTKPVFLNSVPKCGTHLVRNILRMFVPVSQQYSKQFIQFGILQDHLKAFDQRTCNLSWGHLLFSDASAIELKNVRKLVLFRDPYDWVLARARFFLSDEFSGNVDHVKNGGLTVEEFLNLMIFGIHGKVPPMSEIFMFNAVAWLGANTFPVRYEDVVKHVRALETRAAERYFEELLEACGIAMTADWRERVRVGADRRFSGTARENLTGLTIDIPDVLPEMQKRLVDFATPGLRAILGYA